MPAEQRPEHRRRVNGVGSAGQSKAVRGRVADVRRQLQQAMHAGGILIRRKEGNIRDREGAAGPRGHGPQHPVGGVGEKAKRCPGDEIGGQTRVNEPRDIGNAVVNIIVIEVQFVPVCGQ